LIDALVTYSAIIKVCITSLLSAQRLDYVGFPSVLRTFYGHLVVLLSGITFSSCHFFFIVYLCAPLSRSTRLEPSSSVLQCFDCCFQIRHLIDRIQFLTTAFYLHENPTSPCYNVLLNMHIRIRQCYIRC